MRGGGVVRTRTVITQLVTSSADPPSNQIEFVRESGTTGASFYSLQMHGSKVIPFLLSIRRVGTLMDFFCNVFAAQAERSILREGSYYLGASRGPI